MFRKVFRKLTKKQEKEKQASPSKPRPSKPPLSPLKEKPKAKVLTAEGWKRLMMKKYRK
jgi:hypothetical protein